VNAVPYDFGPLAEGDTLPASATDCVWLTGTVTRLGGTLRIALILPHGAGAPPQTRFPSPIILTAAGPVELPPAASPPLPPTPEVPE